MTTLSHQGISAAHRSGDPRPRNEARNKALMERCLAHLRVDPAPMLERARRHLDLVERERTGHPSYVEAWRKLLEMPPDELEKIVLEDSDRAVLLRSTSPL